MLGMPSKPHLELRMHATRKSSTWHGIKGSCSQLSVQEANALSKAGVGKGGPGLMSASQAPKTQTHGKKQTVEGQGLRKDE